MFRAAMALAVAFGSAPGIAAAGADVAPPPTVAYDRVEVPPVKTSIYIGTVSLTMPPLVRKNGIYETTYTAKVFPLFFYNEAGRFFIPLSDLQLQALARGEAIEFKGHGVRRDGAERRVEGKATPADATGGKLKVRVFVSAKVELIFNTTYRFAPAQ